MTYMDKFWCKCEPMHIEQMGYTGKKHNAISLGGLVTARPAALHHNGRGRFLKFAARTRAPS